MVKDLLKMKENIRIRGDSLWYFKNDNYRRIISSKDQETLIRNIRSRLGHVGIEKTKKIIFDNYY